MITSGRSSAAFEEMARNLPVAVHLALDLARLLVEHGAVGAHHAERQLPLAAVVDEIGAQVRDLRRASRAGVSSISACGALALAICA